MDDMTPEELTSVLSAMKQGDIITFPGGGIASRNEDGWEITLPKTASQEFRELLGGE